jgi:glycosyltransferase involved in cell wall biosynthesis
MAIKTLHLTNAFHTHSGGISTFYKAMLQMANQQQREMRLIVPGAEDRVEQVGCYGRIYTVSAPRAPFYGSYRCLYPTSYLYPENTIRRILREERPDVIEICDKYNLHYLGGLIREGLLGDLDFRPLMLGLSCERMDENVAAYVANSAFHRAFCRWYMHWIYFPLFDHHIAVSEHAASELVAASRKHRVRRGIWIRSMGVDVTRFSPDRRSTAMRQHLLQKSNGGPGTLLLLYAGRLAPEKILPLLIGMIRLRRSPGVPGSWRAACQGEGRSRHAFAHRWDRAALAYFSLYDAILAEFRAGDTLAGSPAYAWSTPATLYADAVIAASSAPAQTFFRAVDRFGRQSSGSEIASRRYVQMVPSVTAREEKSAVTLHPRRAD